MPTAERVFRPRFTVVVCVVISLAFVAGAAFLLLTLAGLESDHTADALAIVIITVIAVLTCWVLGRPRAVADREGIAVRNPILSRYVAWEEIVAVRFGRHDPWVLLDLADGSSHPVLAVQAADGARARRDADWLRRRVAAHEGQEPPAAER
ncbi:PH domain-containing protein [Pseudactinotalea suaedae]|uniref:PH domain-containing protein n=1 Tax=Pseudactinotalea suaedae TaxID=1524924 RepID=UPI0012E2B121|nr:PH domain-containing protein [Pseudactinotalea suaedae]